jgi:hypothetical protein
MRCLLLFALSIALAGQAPNFERIELAEPYLGTQPFRAPQLVTGDFNGDGKLDIVAVSNLGDGRFDMRTFGGRGAAIFELTARREFTGYIVIPQHDSTAIAADFDRDGKLDIALPLAGPERGVKILLGDGQGAFSDGPVTPAAGTVCGILAGDLNGDGIPDLAVSLDSSGEQVPYCGVHTMLGRGDGTFAAGAAALPVLVVGYSIAFTDWNRDGKLDLAFTSIDGSGVLLGNGDGGFQRYGEGVLDLPRIWGQSVTAADIDGDGWADLAIGVGGDRPQVVVLFGSGDGGIHSETRIDSGPVSGGVSDIRCGDFNGDGKPDLLVGHNFATYLTFLAGTGEASFEPGVLFSAAADRLYAVQDLNTDGRPDLIIPNYFGKSVSVLLSAGAK